MFALLLWICTSVASAQEATTGVASHMQATLVPQSTRPPSWGLHGMVLFGGKNGLFASHLPMFHAPHDGHVVIALQIASPAIDAAMRTRLTKTPALWTLVPEEFELARLAPHAASPLSEFKADIVEGHFERGGKTIYAGVTVRVIRTDRYIRLDPKAKPATAAHYMPIGQGRTWFLVKEVQARPDFDHIVMLSATHAPTAITVSVRGIARPTDSSLKALMSTDESIIGTVYYDTEDLQ